MYNLMSRSGGLWTLGMGSSKQLVLNKILQNQAASTLPVIQKTEVSSVLSLESEHKGSILREPNNEPDIISYNLKNKIQTKSGQYVDRCDLVDNFASSSPLLLSTASAKSRSSPSPTVIQPSFNTSNLNNLQDAASSSYFQDSDDIISHKSYMVPTDFYCQDSSSNSSDKSQPPDEKKPDLDQVAFELTYELVNTFVKNADWRIYHPKLIFEDRIRGKRTEGLLAYMKFINFVKLIAHLRFVYIRFHIINLSKHPEDNTIRIRWRVAGLGVTRMALRYIPDKMWKRGNMDKAAPTWYDGYSVFHVGPDNKIFKHVADRRMPDQEKESVVNPVVEKLKKLKPNPAPAM